MVNAIIRLEYFKSPEESTLSSLGVAWEEVMEVLPVRGGGSRSAIRYEICIQGNERVNGGECGRIAWCHRGSS